jgi:hypothetical protein
MGVCAAIAIATYDTGKAIDLQGSVRPCRIGLPYTQGGKYQADCAESSMVTSTPPCFPALEQSSLVVKPPSEVTYTFLTLLS